jgi:hypothetical protein
MEERIAINKTEKNLTITIKAFLDEKKQRMLLIWMVLFSFCGVAIITQFFGDYDKGTKVFFGVYVAFWLFFEFKVVYAFRWRKNGLERIIIENEEIILIKEIGKRGITQRYPLNEVKNFRIFINEDTDFVKSMTSSYWNINKYTLAFDFNETPVPFAIDLDSKKAKHILKEIKSFVS